MSSQREENCPEKEIFIKSFLGELPWEEMEQFIDHVSSCPACVLKFRTLQRVRSDLMKKEIAGIGEVLSAAEKRNLRKLARKRLGDFCVVPARPFLRPLLAGIASISAIFLLISAGYLCWTNFHPGEDILRGSFEEGLRLLQPEGKLEEAPSLFIWKKAEGAECYSFELIDDELRVLYQENLYKTELELPAEVRRKLEKGQTYLWSVEVCGDNRDRFAPATAYFELD